MAIMTGWHEGYSEADRINFCPHCGEKVDTRKPDGRAHCPNCGITFAVIDTDDSGA